MATDQYIAMMKESPVQKEWKPKVGDWWVCSCKACQDAKRFNLITSTEIDALNKRDLNNIFKPYADMIKSVGQDFVDHWHEARDIFIWLPTSDDWWEIIGEGEFANNQAWYKIGTFHDWVRDEGRYHYENILELLSAFWHHERGLRWEDNQWRE